MTLAEQIEAAQRVAWAAGVLDALGWWGASSREPGIYAPRILVGRNRRVTNEVVEGLEQALGGHVSAPRGQRNQWTVSGAKGCLAAGEALLPHLRVKTDKARAHMALCRRIVEYTPASFQDRSLPQTEIQVRRDLAKAMDKAWPSRRQSMLLGAEVNNVTERPARAQEL